MGALLMVAGVLEGLHSFRRVSESARRWAYASAGVTLFMGLLVLNAPLLAGTALILLLAASFFVDGLQSALALGRQRDDRRTTLTRALAVVGNLAVAGLLLLLWWRTSTPWTIALAGRAPHLRSGLEHGHGADPGAGRGGFFDPQESAPA